MKYGSVPIKYISPGSIAEEAGLEPGDRIVSINGEKIRDVFDYRFLAADENVVVETLKKDGEVWEIEIEKDEYEDLGIEFEDSMMDEAKSCKNRCIFCFIDQLPKGMRQSVYFKDDDSRLSFLTGNYVTLTNMNENDIDRIIRYRMSPINVSVHTTNPGLRAFMLRNKKAGDVAEKIKNLAKGGITVNCQIVALKGVNDGKELDSSISDLGNMYPGVKSISVVPVGITKHRKGLYDLIPYDMHSSKETVLQVEKWQKKFVEKFGSRVVYLADEFYIMAGLELPGYEEYEDFPQIENGVGLVSLLRHEFDEYLEQTDYQPSRPRSASIATGISACGYIREMADKLEARFNNIKINVYEIKNCFFGENVTVAGLLTGRDIVSGLSGKDLGCELLISRCMLKAGEDLLLDDFTVGMVEEQLNIKIRVVENSGKDFVEKMLGKDI